MCNKRSRFCTEGIILFLRDTVWGQMQQTLVNVRLYLRKENVVRGTWGSAEAAVIYKHINASTIKHSYVKKKKNTQQNVVTL